MAKTANKIIIVLAVLAAAVLCLPKSIEALTPAGVIINNQATATYTDASSQVQATSSNLVQTLVKEVVGVLITTPLIKGVTPSDTFYFPHFLTNVGNGPESYTVCLDQQTLAGSNDFTFDNLDLFLDDDQNGLPDSGTPFTSKVVSPGDLATLGLDAASVCFQIPALNGGEAIQVIVAVTTPAGIVEPNTAQYAIQVFADSDITVVGANTDQAFVTDEPIVEVLKSISETQGISPSGPYTITLTYRNISVTDAQNLEITDILPTEIFPAPASGFERNAGMTYVAGSAVWIHDGEADVTMTDSSLVAQPSGSATTSATYCAYDAACNATPFVDDRLAIRVGDVLAGQEGTITFDVDIDANLFDSDVLRNVVQYSYENTSNVPIPATGTLDSNAITFVIVNAVAAPGVVANDSDSSPLLGVDDSDDLNNVVSVASIEQGTSAIFENYIWNSGDGIDSFDITVDDVLNREGNAISTPFPVGTTFELLKPDGVTALLDTNGNSIPDTGPLNPSESFKVVLRITPPATLTGDNSGNGWDVTKVATSFADSNISNAVTDRLDLITESIIDLTNAQIYDEDCVDGTGAGDGGAGDTDIGTLGTPTPLATGCDDPQGEGYPAAEAAFVNSFEVGTGATIFIPLWSHNVGGAGDSFNLEYSNTNFSAGTLPIGWEVKFFDGNGGSDCAAVGDVVTSTGLIGAGSQLLACARIEIGDDVLADGVAQSIYFRVISPVTGNVDIKHEQIIVTQNPVLSIVPDHFGQATPGEFINYPHQIDNYGNTDLECINITLVDTLAAGGWKSLVYLDVDEDAQLGPGDVELSDQVLAPGEFFKIIVRVFVPATATQSTINKTTVTVNGVVDDNDADPNTCTGAVVTDEATDSTIISDTDIRIVKTQAPDADCDGVPDSAYVFTQFQVAPAECIAYRLVSTNVGVEQMFSLVVSDDTPPFTVYNAAAQDCTVIGGNPADCSPTVVAPANGSTGVITWSIVDLLSGGTITATFGVKVE